MNQARLDFFVSYTLPDEAWASWIARVLKEQGFSVTMQACDFAAGSNFAFEMHKAASEASRTIAVLSPAYLKSAFAAPEWAAAFANDPEGIKRTLVPVRVQDCEAGGLLKAIVYIDLVDLNEDDARERLLEHLSGRRAKPSSKPPFPDQKRTKLSEGPRFPGASKRSALVDHYVPDLKRSPSDLDKRRFLQRAFDSIVKHFDRSLKELASQQEGIEYELRPVTSAK